MDLKNKVAVVTGSSSGIGEAVAIALGKEGAKVVVNARKNIVGGKRVVDEIKKTGGEALFVRADVSDPKEAKYLFEEIVGKYGSVDILVNNAGESRAGEPDDIELWKEQFENILLSQVIVTCEFVKLKSFSQRKIVNTSSIYGSRLGSNLCYIAYGAAKAGVDSFTVNMAKKLGREILVNAVAPGWTWTPPWGDNRAVEEKLIKDKAVIGRFVEPEEIAQTVLMILKNDAITGQIITVDGGATLKDLS